MPSRIRSRDCCNDDEDDRQVPRPRLNGCFLLGMDIMRVLLKLMFQNIRHPLMLAFCELILIAMTHFPITTAVTLSIVAITVELGFIGWAVRVSGPENPVGAPLRKSPQRQCDW